MKKDTTPASMPQESGKSHGFVAAATEHLLLHGAGALIGGAIAGPPGAVLGGLAAGLSHTSTLEAPTIPYQPPTSTTSSVKKTNK